MRMPFWLWSFFHRKDKARKVSHHWCGDQRYMMQQLIMAQSGRITELEARIRPLEVKKIAEDLVGKVGLKIIREIVK